MSTRYASAKNTVLPYYVVSRHYHASLFPMMMDLVVMYVMVISINSFLFLLSVLSSPGGTILSLSLSLSIYLFLRYNSTNQAVCSGSCIYPIRLLTTLPQSSSHRMDNHSYDCYSIPFRYFLISDTHVFFENGPHSPSSIVVVVSAAATAFVFWFFRHCLLSFFFFVLLLLLSLPSFLFPSSGSTPSSSSSPLLSSFVYRIVLLFYRGSQQIIETTLWWRISLLSWRDEIQMEKESVWTCFYVTCPYRVFRQ